MESRTTRDKSEIYRFLSATPELQLYAIGDLDDFFWPDTVWHALYDMGEIKSVALLYTGMKPHTLLSFYDNDPFYSVRLLKSVKHLLPEKFNVHLSPGLINIFGKENIIEDYGHNYRMILAREPETVYDDNIRKLYPGDLAAIYSLYKVAYPANWFDSRMIETGMYLGYFNEEILAGIAGIHVYSSQYRIAALGNIATHPAFRGRKIAYKLTSALCCDLKNSVDIIGLNVKSDNLPAIKCYEKIGFETRSSYDECLVRNSSL
ncbi:MAG: GNAT family N-acetyltransferase [Odoribacter sp.]|nr:GNAT family N-acetyltransferase [Odoribacter sp.]